MMTKDEARKELDAMPARKAELEKILAEPDVDPRELIGKLCVIVRDADISFLPFILEKADIKRKGLSWASTVVRPVTPSDLEGKIYQPKKKTLYDWVEILKKYPEAKWACTREDGTVSATDGTRPFYDEGDDGWWIVVQSNTIGWVEICKESTPCPDWRDSLEENPEGV